MFDAPHFQSHDEARKYLEALRWGGEPVCPHCGTIGRAYATKKEGVYRCAESTCRKDFSVTTKTVMESSHVKLHVWLRAFYLMTSSKKGMSAHQLHRTLKVTYKTAWFLAHRIREAMREGGLAPMGGGGGIVEADETYFGKYDTPRERKTKRYTKPTKGGKSGPANKRAIVALVERGGPVRTFHVAVADKPTVDKIVKDNVDRETRIHTDESRLYGDLAGHFASHETVKHSGGEYVRGDVHTNSAEGYFSIFKRGMRGVYQHCREKHLHRYLAEYDFRYNHRAKLGFNDGERADAAIRGAANKRLTYRQPR
ncbi:MAG: IS1595 family transposase [Pseudorhodoplanes sp.]|nr:IS1595 family transposase ISNwi1 [Pseudorhodoplanes sp.]MBW7948834.1 IS1595 family transposase [Pseudorhodoplanes sp.]